MWEIKNIVSKGDYLYAVVPDHPNRTKNNYVLHHRVVMENHLGRLLNPDEVVHHINEDKKDNRIENLEVLSISDHHKHHRKDEGRAYVELKCPNCQVIFHRPREKTHLMQNRSSYTCCGKQCAGQFSWDIRRKTSRVELGISQNVVREYRIFLHDDSME